MTIERLNPDQMAVLREVAEAHPGEEGKDLRALLGHIDALEGVDEALSDEEAAHADTLRLWRLREEERDAARRRVAKLERVYEHPESIYFQVDKVCAKHESTPRPGHPLVQRVTALVAELEAEVARLQRPGVVREMAGRVLTYDPEATEFGLRTLDGGLTMWWGNTGPMYAIWEAEREGYIVDRSSLPADVRAELGEKE